LPPSSFEQLINPAHQHSSSGALSSFGAHLCCYIFPGKVAIFVDIIYHQCALCGGVQSNSNRFSSTSKRLDNM
jgi:hypothetical protein